MQSFFMVEFSSVNNTPVAAIHSMPRTVGLSVCAASFEIR